MGQISVEIVAPNGSVPGENQQFCRLKDWRRIATRYDKLAHVFASAVYIAAIIIWWAY
jgi:transposase